MSWNTDPLSTPPCDRNDCRCGDNKNCMYYNSAGPGQAHYNYVAVQGAGDPQSPYYGCMRKSMDLYNAEDYYADHAGQAVPGYAAQPARNELYWSRNNYHEADAVFCNHGVPAPKCPICLRIRDQIRYGAGRQVLGVPVWIWVVIAVIVVLMWARRNGRLPSLSNRRTQFALIAVVPSILNVEHFSTFGTVPKLPQDIGVAISGLPTTATVTSSGTFVAPADSEYVYTSTSSDANSNSTATQTKTLTNTAFDAGTSGGLAIGNIGSGVGRAGSGLEGTDAQSGTFNAGGATLETARSISTSSIEDSQSGHLGNVGQGMGAFTSNGSLSGGAFEGPPPAMLIDPDRTVANPKLNVLGPDNDTAIIGKFQFSRESIVSPPIIPRGPIATRWNNRTAAEYLNVLVGRLGLPSSVDPSVGGMAVWRSELLANTCLSRVEIRDEAVIHAVPVNHFDFIYCYVRFPLQPSKFLDVTSLSCTIGYDQATKMLWARCRTLDACIVTLALATQIGAGYVSLNYANANNMLSYYLTASQDPQQTYRLFDLLCYNIKTCR